jgi:hypothetical protein
MENRRGKHEVVTGKRSGSVYRSLPQLDLERNGAASTSANPGVPESFGSTIMRLKVPRTAVLSVPVYGQNVYGEQETVVAGTAYKAWVAWESSAPTFDEIPL